MISDSRKYFVKVRLSRLILLVAHLAVLSDSAQSQSVTVYGHVYGLPENQPIPYANIGIVNSSLGTISNFDGSFTIRIEPSYTKDSLLFSALGYHPITVPVKALLQKPTLNVFLKENVYSLTEIVVSDTRLKNRIKTVGNRHHQGGTLYADTVHAGATMALLISNKNRRGASRFNYPIYITHTDVMIVNNTFEHFRVRARILQAVEKGGRLYPGDDILQESVVVESDIYEGWLRFDFAGQNIAVTEDFFIAFEWILDKQDRVNLHTQYRDFQEKNPDKIRRQTSIIAGKEITFDNYQGNFFFGTSFGVSVEHSVLRDFTCYYRLNSFGRWLVSPTVLTARVGLSSTPTPLGDRSSALSDLADIGPARSFYMISGQSSRMVGDSSDSTPGFYTVLPEPIQIQVVREWNTLSFFALNASTYPYRMQLSFSRIFNLTPTVKFKEAVVYPGRTRIHVFDVVFSDLDNYHYELGVVQTIGDPNKKTDMEYPYLIPLTHGSVLELGDSLATLDQTDHFQLDQGSPLVASRKGIVCSSCREVGQQTTISANCSVELRHADGTMMVYDNLDSAEIQVETKQTVLPGDTIARMLKSKAVQLKLYELDDSGSLQRLTIHYLNGSNSLQPYSRLSANLIVKHPPKLLRQEHSSSLVR